MQLAARPSAAGPAVLLHELVAEFRRLSAEMEALEERLAVAKAVAFEKLGPCPMIEEAANEAWWAKYRRTDAWRIENDWDRLADRHGAVLARIMETPAGDVAEAAEKLEAAVLHCDLTENAKWALDAVLRDLRTLSADAGHRRPGSRWLRRLSEANKPPAKMLRALCVLPRRAAARRRARRSIVIDERDTAELKAPRSSRKAGFHSPEELAAPAPRRAAAGGVHRLGGRIALPSDQLLGTARPGRDRMQPRPAGKAGAISRLYPTPRR
jgi:hypothetical protein